MEFEYSKLKGRIIEKFDSYGNFAKVMGFTKSQLSNRLNNVYEWRQEDIHRAAELLELDNLKEYFFTKVSEKAD